MGRILLVFGRRLWLPLLVLAGLLGACVIVYTRLEPFVRLTPWFWVFYTHGIDYKSVRPAASALSSIMTLTISTSRSPLAP